MTEALSAATAAVEGKMGKGLKKVLKKVFSSDVQDSLAVADAKLGGAIKDKLNISCVHSSAINELFRGIRNQMANLITGMYCFTLLLVNVVCVCRATPVRTGQHGSWPVSQPLTIQAKVQP